MRRRAGIRAIVAAALAAGAAMLADPAAACSPRYPAGGWVEVWLAPDLVIATRMTGHAPLYRCGAPLEPMPPRPDETLMTDENVRQWRRYHDALIGTPDVRVELTVTEVLREAASEGGATPGVRPGDVITVALQSSGIIVAGYVYGFSNYVKRHAFDAEAPTILLGLYRRPDAERPVHVWRIAGAGCSDMISYDDGPRAARVRARLAEAAAGR